MTNTAIAMGVPMSGPRTAPFAAVPGSRAACSSTPASTITQLPAVVNLSVYQGDDFYLDLTVTDAGGAAADLTGFTATAQVRSSPAAIDPPMAVFTCTIAGNIIHLHLPAVEAAKLENPAMWDCQIVATDVVTLVYGKVIVTLQITR